MALVSSALGGWARAKLSGVAAGPVVAARVRETLEGLGPAFVKLGQAISVRPDVFPPDLVFELSKLQDAVPAGTYAEAEEVMRSEFGVGPERLFARFDREPLAAGSIAQVHTARLCEGGEEQEVVVKVQRRDAARLMALDLEIAARLARLAQRLGVLRGVDAPALVEEFAESVRRELDFRVEASHADRFAFLFRFDPDVLIPKVFWRRTSGRMLTMQRIDGFSLGRLAEARKAGVDTARLARVGARAFMQQVLVYGFFHADLHPANILLTPDGRLAYLDFGIVGQLSQVERRHVARLLAALTEHEPARALDVSRQLGVVVPQGRRKEIVAELGTLLDRFLREDSKVELMEFGKSFLALLRRYRVRIPTGYGLLVKALVTVEGVSQTLAPEINLVAAARPVARALGLRMALGETLAGELAWRLMGSADKPDKVSGGSTPPNGGGSDYRQEAGPAAMSRS